MQSPHPAATHETPPSPVRTVEPVALTLPPPRPPVSPSLRLNSGEPGIAVVVVTWNRRQVASDVLAAIARQEFPLAQLDVIVVDNGSTDGTVGFLTERWHPEAVVENPTDVAHQPDFRRPVPPTPSGSHPAPSRANATGFRSLTIIRNARNHGGCGGFNTGFAYVEHALDVKGRPGRPAYVWLVDDDVDLPPDALLRLTETAEADESIGIVGSRTVDYHNRDTTIETTIYFDFSRGRMADEPPPGHPRYDDHRRWIQHVGGTKGTHAFSGVRDVDVVSACSLLARWSGVRKVGFWDYRYFIYCDDADWCLRFAKAGYRVVCDLDAVVYHTPWHQKLTPARIYYSQRNIVWLIQKIIPRPRLRRATARWLASILWDCFRAALNRRLFHAEIIRRTADDITTNTGGTLADPSPAPVPVTDALASINALSPSAHLAVMCWHPASVAWADELRAHVAASLAASGRQADAPRWTYIVRNDIPDPGRDLPAPPDAAPLPRRIVHSIRMRARLRRQLPLLLDPPSAVVIFDQSNHFPLLRGRHNIHIDRKKPTEAQLERNSAAALARFMLRWAVTAARCALHVLALRPYASPTKYG